MKSEGRYKEAIATVDKALNQDLGSAQRMSAYYIRATSNESLGDGLNTSVTNKAAARSFYQRAIEDYKKESGYPDQLLLSALHSIASVYIKLNEFDEAKKYIAQMHKLPRFGDEQAQELLKEIKEKSINSP